MLSNTNIGGSSNNECVSPLEEPPLVPVFVPAISVVSPPTHACTVDGGSVTRAMLGVHNYGGNKLPIFGVLTFPVPTNVNIGNWVALCITKEDDRIFQYFQFGF